MKLGLGFWQNYLLGKMKFNVSENCVLRNRLNSLEKQLLKIASSLNSAPITEKEYGHNLRYCYFHLSKNSDIIVFLIHYSVGCQNLTARSTSLPAGKGDFSK